MTPPTGATWPAPSSACAATADYLGELYPRRDYYYEAQQPMTIPGVRSTLEDDLYVLLVDWQPISSQGATFKVYHNPLVNWLWLGGLVFILGTMVAAWPDQDPELRRAAQRKSAPRPPRPEHRDEDERCDPIITHHGRYSWLCCWR